MNVTAAKNTEPGMKIPTLTGKVEEVYQRRNGTSDKGPWTVQKLKLSEGRDWIFIDLWNRDDLAPYKGHQIKITCDRGIEVKENNWTDKSGNSKTGLAFSASKSAVITSPGFGDEDGNTTQPHANTAQQAQAQPPPHIPPPAIRGEVNEPYVKRRLNQLANLYLNCMVAADYVYANPAAAALTPDDYREVVTTLFIQATREGLTDHIAVGKFHVAEKHEAPAPQPPPPPPAPVAPQPAPRTPANPQYGDHRDSGAAFDPNEGGDENCPF